MFGWLANLFVSRRDRDRQIFRYWDGAKQRAIDPYVAYRGIWDGCDLIADAKIACNPTGDDGMPIYPAAAVNEANDRLRAMTCQVFGVSPWSENTPGLTLHELDELLHQFMGYIEDIKKKRKSSPTSSAPSGSREPASSADTAACPAGAAPDCNSTPSESTSAALSGR